MSGNERGDKSSCQPPPFWGEEADKEFGKSRDNNCFVSVFCSGSALALSN